MPVKDIVTKYFAHTPKSKKINNDAHLAKDPIIGKVIEEVATYKKKEGSSEVEAKEFKITTMDLGVLTWDIDNHIFKFSSDHMLIQSKKDSKEKRELEKLVTTMAKYIDSLMNIGALPLI